MLRSIVLGLLVLTWTSASLGDDVWYLGVADTDDDDIGEAVLRDIQAMEDLLEPVADRADWSLRRSVLYGENVTRAAILETIEDMKNDRPDVVIFYYSGHGAGSPKNDPYPTLTIAGPDIRFSEIYDELRAANPRLLLVMTDACNVPDREPASYAVERTPASLSDDGLLKLLQQRGTFLATAASRGEYAYTGASPHPSVFTKRLIAVLKAESGHAEPEWSRIRAQLGKAIDITFTDGEDLSQTPFVRWDGAP